MSLLSLVRGTYSDFKWPFTNHFKHWLHRRIPPQQSITLNQRSIFIFPTKTGFVFSVLMLSLLVGAINYENSLIFGLVFWLSALFFITIFYTYKNLSGITIELQNCKTGFVNEDIEFVIKVTRPENSKREGIQLGWPDAVKQWAELYETESSVVHLFVKAQRRGWLNPGRLLIETYFPLGLLRAWTWVDMDAKTIVYPKPLSYKPTEQYLGSDDEGHLTYRQGSDDFYDMREYQAGDSPRHILWRSYARQDELLVKKFAAYADTRLMLDWFHIEGDTELRLSRLTGMALNAHRKGKEFGLKLPQLALNPDIGKAHLDRVLKELALYGLSH